jgi:uncharacterized protein (TIGR02001 family)
MSIIKSASLGAASLLAMAVFAGPSFADGLPSRGKVAAAEPARPCTFTGNVGVTTDYVFRGISQTLNDAAVQGGVDATCGNFYVGFWGSNVEFAHPFGDSNVEMDFYGGYKFKTGAINWDLGAIYYSYPGTDTFGFLRHNSYFELKAGASGDIWKGGTLGATVFYSPDYFGSTGSVWTVEGAFSQTLPRFSIFSPTFSATLGYSRGGSEFAAFFTGDERHYTYWNVGLNLAFYEKWSLDLRYWDTSIDGGCFVTGGVGETCDGRFVASMKYTF